MTWVDNDLTRFAGGARANGFALDGYSEGDGSQHVNFIDESGHVHELYRSPDPAAQWADNDLTVLTGAPPADVDGFALDGYSQGDGSQHVNFVNFTDPALNQHVHELYRSPDPAAQWADNDLTVLTGGTRTPAGGGLYGYSQGDGSQHVNFTDGSAHVHELYRSPDPAAQWVDNDLTVLTGAPLTDSSLVGYSQGDGSQHVNFIDANQHVHELYRSPDPAAQWVDNDLTKFAGGTPAEINASGPYGYSQGDGSQHVNFIDANQHVHELYRSPDPAAQWADNDLTKFAGGTPAKVTSELVGYLQGDGSQHVNFIDADGHVHELYRSPDPAAQWVDNDLTKFAGGTPALTGSLDGYLQGDGSQHVNFIDADGHVHELYGSP